MGQGLRRVQVEKHYRYIVFDPPNSSSVVGMFTTNGEQPRCLFRNAAVWIPSRDYPSQHRGSKAYSKNHSNNKTAAFSSNCVWGCSKRDNSSPLRCRRQQPKLLFFQFRDPEIDYWLGISLERGLWRLIAWCPNVPWVMSVFRCSPGKVLGPVVSGSRPRITWKRN